MKPALERFLAKVQMTDGCWIWTGHRHRKGHGRFRVSPGVLVMAHRFSYEQHKGPIPEGMCVCHSCDVPACVNPAHLWLGTKAENNADRASKGRNADTSNANNPSAKLSEADVRCIKALLADGAVQIEIARKFSVTSALVSAIKHGKAWKSV